jgi:methionine-S-sulfoxide reductase
LREVVFGGVEELFSELEGVLKTEVGYTGGSSENPIYNQVKTGKTGHAEAIQIHFDPTKTSYEKILEYFFRLHDPTTLNRQGNDVGSQYRSAIFYHTEKQRISAEEIKIKINNSGKWKNPVVTEIEKATPFYSAEDFHQKYLKKNPNGYTCHFLRD